MLFEILKPILDITERMIKKLKSQQVINTISNNITIYKMNKFYNFFFLSRLNFSFFEV